jgi:hypothetical protein
MVMVEVGDETTVSPTKPITRAMLPAIKGPQLAETGEVPSCSDYGLCNPRNADSGCHTTLQRPTLCVHQERARTVQAVKTQESDTRGRTSGPGMAALPRDVSTFSSLPHSCESRSRGALSPYVTSRQWLVTQMCVHHHDASGHLQELCATESVNRTRRWCNSQHSNVELGRIATSAVVG